MLESRIETLTLDDGATTTIERWGTTGPVILCVHGMVSSRRSWLRFARHYAERYQVVAYDQRGHGDSASLTGPMSLERGVRDFTNAVKHIGDVDMAVGHSWGGAVVVRGGLRTPVHAVAAIDPMIVQVADDWYAEYLAELDETFAVTDAARDAAIRAAFCEWHPDDSIGKVHAMHAMTSAPIAGLRDENRDGAWDLRVDMARYAKPLLLLMAGREGSIVPAAVYDAIEGNGTPVRVERLCDQGHNLHRTAFGPFAAMLDRFLLENLLQEPEAAR